MAFMTIEPMSVGHTLVVPKSHAERIYQVEPATAGHLFSTVPALVKAVTETTKADGVNLVLADGSAAGQTAFHTHLHIIPRYYNESYGIRFWPHYVPGQGRTQLNDTAAAIKGNLGYIQHA